MLAVASATARKNLASLAPLADHVEVVIAGGGRPQFAAEAGLERLTRLGHVDEADLPGLYAGAELVVIPSKHEGFGLIALEAMASGTPVVAARAGALPDTVGDAGDVTDDVAGAAMRTAAATRRSGSASAPPRLQRAAAFSWDATARAVDALLRGTEIRGARRSDGRGRCAGRSPGGWRPAGRARSRRASSASAGCGR